MSAAGEGGDRLELYDTTLRDGTQQAGINLGVADKLTVARLLDRLGVHYIEAGWPGANDVDTRFFSVAREQLELKNAELVAFGSTRRSGESAARSPVLKALLDSEAPTLTLVAKAHRGHVERALRVAWAENLAMIASSVAYLVDRGREVIIDAEHFFDGYWDDPRLAAELIRCAADSGARCVALCDTNGGMLPHQVESAVADIGSRTELDLGIHCHNDTGCAVANSMVAVRAGASQLQGTINGLGERTGNANLVTLIGNLQFKMGFPLLSPLQLRLLTETSEEVAAVTGEGVAAGDPYVGRRAFTHKAGLHASALRVDPGLYQHIAPEDVGNKMRTVVSGLAGRASIELKAAELGIVTTADSERLARVVERVKVLEGEGIPFDRAEASLELLMREELTPDEAPLVARMERSVRPIPGLVSDATSDQGGRFEAWLRVRASGRPYVSSGVASTPEDAVLLAAGRVVARIRGADTHLVVAESRSLDRGAGPPTWRILLNMQSHEGTWCTVGVASDKVEACWEAVREAIRFASLRASLDVPVAS